MVKTKAKKAKKKKKVTLTPHELEKRAHQKEVRSVLFNIGYSRIPRIDGKEFTYSGRKSEIDDMFYNENVLLLVEYTTADDTGKHLINKKVFCDLVNNDPTAFIEFILEEPKFKHVKEIFAEKILNKYTINQIQLKMIYASKKQISDDHKNLVAVAYFDYPIVKYFQSITKVIKKTAIYEFHEFIKIRNECFGDNINNSNFKSENTYDGHILPEEHSSFKRGYKLISFYIDANALMRRAYVLRNGGWRDVGLVKPYQRLLFSKKISSMRKYLNDENRVFVNNIIATLPEDKVKLFSKDGAEIIISDSGDMTTKDKTKVQPATISIEDEVNIIGIIDGQHRAFSYHEGDDKYEKKIAKLRKIQNLLVTGILFPKAESDVDRLKFQAKLFLEINSNQTSATSALKHDIESYLEPYSSTSIAKHVLEKLNKSGALSTFFESYWFETDKIKTTTIISYGLKPLVKLSGDDSLFHLWKNKNKEELKKKTNSSLLSEYNDFCIKELQILFSSLRSSFPNERWKITKRDTDYVVNITFINAAINCLRELIRAGKTGDIEYYKEKFKDIANFNFKTYKTTHYRQMGVDWYAQYFK